MGRDLLFLLTTVVTTAFNGLSQTGPQGPPVAQ